MAAPVSPVTQTATAAMLAEQNQLDPRLRIHELEAELAELKISEARLSFALDGTGDGLWDWDIAKSTVEFSPRWKAMLGHEEHEIGHELTEWSSRVHPDDLPRVMADAMANLEGKTTSFANEHRVRCKDGSYLWVLDRGKVVQRDAEGKALRMVGTHTDISNQKIASRLLENALHESAALLSALNMHAIVSAADKAGNIIDVNDAFCAISGYSRAELMGKNHRIVNSGVQPREFWVDMWSNISSGKPWRGTVCNRAKNGSHYWVDTFIAPFKDADGNIEKYISIRTDITAAKNQEDALRAAKQTADEASQAKSEFLANMSHEIRTPMNAILGMLSLLRKTELSARQEDYASKTEGAARSLLGILNDILDLSKTEAGKMQLDPQPFQTDRMLHDVSVILSANVGNKPVELLFDIDPTLPHHLIGDAMRLQQVLMNLGGNAIKFTEKGEVLLKIEVLQKMDDAVTLRFSVRDSGIGIAPENQARIFSGFTQAEASTTRRFGGTGLGVAISQNLVRLMGGEIELHSALGAGSEFFFSIRLPLANEAIAQERFHPAPSAVNTAVEQRLVGMRILIAEDNLNNQQVVRELLESEGAIITIANNGQEAVDAVATASPGFDVVLMDLQMPVMDGFTATHNIRHVLTKTNLPIVAMTANVMPSDREACFEVGMNDHVGKPFDIDHLIQILRKQARWQEVNGVMPEMKVEHSPPTNLTKVAQDAGVDFVATLRRLGGKQELYLRILPMFLENMAILPEQLRGHLAQGELQVASRALHTLKGLAATVGVTPLATEAASGEKILASEPSPEEATVVIEQICAAIAASIPRVKALLTAMQAGNSAEIIEKKSPDANIDTQALQTALAALRLQLQNSDMGAMNAMAALQQQYGKDLQGSELGEPFNALQHAISNLAFEAALKFCAALLERNAQSKSETK